MAAQAPGYPIYVMSRAAAAQPEFSGEEAVARQLREKLQRLVQDGASRGPEWLRGAVADIGRDEVPAMCKAAGLPVQSNDKWLTVPELQEALLAYLASETVKVGSCLIASCMDDTWNWDKVSFLLYSMFSHCKDNGLFQINSWVDRVVQFDLL